jgi:hypothetical protein
MCAWCKQLETEGCVCVGTGETGAACEEGRMWHHGSSFVRIYAFTPSLLADIQNQKCRIAEATRKLPKDMLAKVWEELAWRMTPWGPHLVYRKSVRNLERVFVSMYVFRERCRGYFISCFLSVYFISNCPPYIPPVVVPFIGVKATDATFILSYLSILWTKTFKLLSVTSVLSFIGIGNHWKLTAFNFMLSSVLENTSIILPTANLDKASLEMMWAFFFPRNATSTLCPCVLP